MPIVLVIENDVPAMRLMAWGLMEQGMEVAVAHVPDAAQRLLDRQPEFIVFNTLKRSEEKARLVRQFRSLASDAKIIDVSELSEGESDDIGADAHLRMPLQLKELIDTIQALSD